MNSFFQWLVDFLTGVVPWVIIAPWETAIRVRLGKWTKSLDAGVHLRIPYFDEFIVVNTRLRIATTSLQTVSTKNGHTVSLAASIGFKVTNPLESFRTLESPTATIGAYATTLLTEYVLSRDLKDITIPELNKWVLGKLRDFGVGMEFDFIAITDFAVVKTIRLLSETGRGGVWAGIELTPANGKRPY